ncbi:BOW99_gp33 family protein [Aerococcus viridans]
MVIHIMADGTKRQSVEGYIVKLNERTEKAYKLLAKEGKRN